MSWVAVGVGVAGIAASTATSLATSGGGKKGKGFSMPKTPDFWSDPYVGKSQDELWNFGTNAIDGKLPDTYQPLIEFGSQPFEDMLGMKNRDIISGMTESAAKRGLGRGANISPAISKAIADSSTVARYSDYKDTLTNMRSILGLGVDTVEGVRSGALTNQNQKNAYELNRYGLDYTAAKDEYVSSANVDAANQEGSVQTNDILGQVGNIFGSAEGQDNMLGGLAGLFGGSQSTSKRGSAGGGGTDWVNTGVDIAKLVAMFAAK